MNLNSINEADRRPLLNLFLVSIAVNAALGIWALLVDDFGETQGKILATSFLVSAAMISVLINGPAISRRVLSPIPCFASVAAFGGFALFISFIWLEVDHEVSFKTAFSLMIAAAGGTLVGLIALLELRRVHEVVRSGHQLLTGLLCGTSVLAIWAEMDASWLPRLLGVESVLVAALTLAIPALSRFLPPVPLSTEPVLRFCPACGHRVDSAALTRPIITSCTNCGLEFTVAPIAVEPPEPDLSVQQSN